MDDLDRLHHRLVGVLAETAPHLLGGSFTLADVRQHLLPYRLHRRTLGLESVESYEHALLRLASGERGYLTVDAAVREAARHALAAPAPSLDGFLGRYGDVRVALASAGGRRDEGSGLDIAIAGAGGPPALATAPTLPPPAPPGEDEDERPPAASVDAPGSAPGAPTDDGPADVPDDATDDATDEATDDATAVATDDTSADAPAVATDDAPADAPRSAPVDAPTRPPLLVPITLAPAPGAAPAAAPPTRPDPAAATAVATAMPFPTRPPTPVLGGPCRYCGRQLPAGREVTFCPYCGEDVTRVRCPACSTELEVGWRFCITCGRALDVDGTGEGAGPPGGERRSRDAAAGGGAAARLLAGDLPPGDGR